jgi:hypothetical protein
MNPISLAELLDQVRRTVGDGVPGATGMTLALRFQADRGPDGGLLLRAACADEAVAQGLEVRVGVPVASGTPGTMPVPTPGARGFASAEGETIAGGDPTILRRRLELVLGGGPGFNTGAKAEVLADLMEEYGRPELVAMLRREWVSQFDTGPDSSESVIKVPAARGVPQLSAAPQGP